MIKYWVILVYALVCTACGPAEFSGINGKASGDSVDGTVPQTGDANGSVAENDNDDDEDGAVPQMPVADFLGLLAQNPAEGAVVSKQLRCYISGGGGHGVDVCMPGDKSAISGLWPIEIKGDQLCVPVATLQAKAALFANGKTGECPK